MMYVPLTYTSDANKSKNAGVEKKRSKQATEHPSEPFCDIASSTVLPSLATSEIGITTMLTYLKFAL